MAVAVAPVAFNELDIKDFFEGYYYPFSNGTVTQSSSQKFLFPSFGVSLVISKAASKRHKMPHSENWIS